MNIAFIITAIIICALHICSHLCMHKIANILTYVNLGLHILLVFELLLLEVSFEFMALSFMLSLFVYTLSYALIAKFRERRDARDL
ncbi:MAG: hypothetical protein IKV16_05765 [Clostridia bacterium]|nr:hypothetical protein [Clostridia bacterium]